MILRVAFLCGFLSTIVVGVLSSPGVVFADRGGVVPGDYDGDDRTDIIVARKVAGEWHWYLRLATGAEIGPVPFGLASTTTADILLPGDYDGDGDYNLNVIRDIAGFLNWFSLQNDGTAQQVVWGLSGDTPVTGFFGGQGESDRVAVRQTPAGLVWYIQNIAPDGIPWGLAGDTPYAADYNGDGVDELIVARTEAGNINWYIRDLSGGLSARIPWGLAGDKLLPPSDFNGDGKADLVVTRAIAGFQFTFIRYTDLDLSQQVLFGLATDTPYVGRFTQGAISELAMYRTSPVFSHHFVRFSQEDFVAQVLFGLGSDTLVPPEGPVAAQEVASAPGCVATPGTPTSFVDGGGRGALWKPVSEGVPNHASVVLLPISYCGATLTVLGADGTPVSGVQRTKCGGNGNRAHFWIARTASQMAPFRPLTVQVQRGGVTECRAVPNPFSRYD